MNKTIAKIGYAMLNETSAGITYEKIKWLASNKAGGREISAEPNGEVNIIYADGLPVVIAEENTGYNINLTLLAIIDDTEKDWYGHKEMNDGSILEKNSSEERPRFALVAAKERFNGNTEYEIDTYFNCICSSRPSRSDKTSEGNFDPEFPQYSIAATPRTDNKYVRLTQYLNELPTEISLPTGDND